MRSNQILNWNDGFGNGLGICFLGESERTYSCFRYVGHKEKRGMKDLLIYGWKRPRKEYGWLVSSYISDPEFCCRFIGLRCLLGHVRGDI